MAGAGGGVKPGARGAVASQRAGAGASQSIRSGAPRGAVGVGEGTKRGLAMLGVMLFAIGCWLVALWRLKGG